MRQTNVSFSRAGVLRGLHYHERGQDDLFACLQRNGTRRRPRSRDGRHVHGGHRRGQSGRDVHPRVPRSRLRSAHGHPVLLPRHGRVRPGRSRRAHGPLERPARRITYGARADRSCPRGTPPSSPDHGRRRPARPRARAGSSRTTTSSRSRAPTGTSPGRSLNRRPRGDELDLVLHTAAWTDVDGAEDGPAGCGGREHRREPPTPPRSSAPLVDLLHRLRLRRPQALAVRRVGRPEPASAYGRTKLHGEAAAGPTAWIVRTSWLFGADRPQLPPDDAPPRRGARRGRGRRRPARLPDVRRPPRRGGAGISSTRTCRRGSGTSRPTATARGPTSRRRSSTEAGLELPCPADLDGELERPAPRPAYSVLRSERAGAPVLPHWRDGLRACLAEMDG